MTSRIHWSFCTNYNFWSKVYKLIQLNMIHQYKIYCSVAWIILLLPIIPIPISSFYFILLFIAGIIKLFMYSKVEESKVNEHNNKFYFSGRS